MARESSVAGTVRAPEFPAGLDWLNTDRPLIMKELRGKIVLLDFWTYGCINCIHIIPDLKRLEKEFPNELVVIGVHSAKFRNEGETENLRRIILRYGIEHPVVNDKDFVVWQTWAVHAWPTTVLVDPAGRVATMRSGEGVYAALKPIIERLARDFDNLGLLDRRSLSLKLEREGMPGTILSFPGKVLADEVEDRLFIADTNHNRIVIAGLGSGKIINIIGSGEEGFQDGNFQTARFNRPQGMALSEDRETLYAADTENHAVRQVDLVKGKVKTLVGTGQQALRYPPKGGVAPNIALNSPWDLALDDDRLYMAMAGTHQIWVMELSSGIIGPFAGSGREGTIDGSLAEAELAQPSGLTLDGEGRLYFVDSEGSSVRWAGTQPGNAQVGTLAGSGYSLFDFGDVDGTGLNARLQHPLGITYHEGRLYIADTYNHKIKVIDPETGDTRTLAGSEGGLRDGKKPLFYEPGGVDAAAGKLHVADTNNHAIRVIDLNTLETTTLELKGIEEFTAARAGFTGRVITLAPVKAGEGGGKIILDVKFPPGYKVSADAPFSVEWHVTDGVVILSPDANLRAVAPSFPLEIPATFNQGEGKLAADLTIYYCAPETEGLCLIDLVRLEAPVRVKEDGDRVVRLEYTARE